MAKYDVVDLGNKKIGQIDLDESVFDCEVNEPLVHQVVTAQLANRRQGTACTKTRAEVKGTTKKPYRQKGTGNARHGSLRSPIFVGGGTTFGPKPRSYQQSTTKKMIQGALRSVLSDRKKSDRLVIVKDFTLKEAKTKALNETLKKKFSVDSVLIVDGDNESLYRSGRNIAGTKVIKTNSLNAYDIVKHEWIFLSQQAAEEIQGRLSRKGEAKS